MLKIEKSHDDMRGLGYIDEQIILSLFPHAIVVEINLLHHINSSKDMNAKYGSLSPPFDGHSFEFHYLTPKSVDS